MQSVHAAAVALLVTACAGPSVRSVPEPVTRRATEPNAAEVTLPLRVSDRAMQSGIDFGSLFHADDGDGVIARVGEAAIHKRHVYDRMLEVDPVRLREIEEALVLDARVREVARQHDVRVPESEVEFAVRREWARVEREFEKQPLGAKTIDVFVERNYSMSVTAFRAHVKMLAWRRLMRSYTIRYAQLRSGTVRLQRFLARTRAEAERAREEAVRGGDLAHLAESASVDSRARAGGRLPLLPLDGGHPALGLGRGVEIGAFGPVRAVPLEDGSSGFGFVRVLARNAPDPRSFEAAYADLRKGLERRPIAQEEVLSFLST